MCVSPESPKKPCDPHVMSSHVPFLYGTKATQSSDVWLTKLSVCPVIQLVYVTAAPGLNWIVSVFKYYYATIMLDLFLFLFGPPFSTLIMIYNILRRLFNVFVFVLGNFVDIIVTINWTNLLMIMPKNRQLLCEKVRAGINSYMTKLLIRSGWVNNPGYIYSHVITILVYEITATLTLQRAWLNNRMGFKSVIKHPLRFPIS